MLYASRQTEIANFGLHALVDEDVAQLQISMDDRV